MTQPYRPSNGTEGAIFEARFCSHCLHFRGDDDYDYCDIVVRAFALDIDDAGYPPEWVEDEGGPRCTAFAETEEARKNYHCPQTPDLFWGGHHEHVSEA